MITIDDTGSPLLALACLNESLDDMLHGPGCAPLPVRSCGPLVPKGWKCTPFLPHSKVPRQPGSLLVRFQDGTLTVPIAPVAVAWQGAEKLPLNQADQKGPDARRRHP